MSKRKPLVVVTRKLPDVVETRMMELFNTRLNASDAPMGRAELIEAVKTAEVLVPTVTDRIDKAVLLQAERRELRCVRGRWQDRGVHQGAP